ncbi:MAG: toxin-antitoxin system YwqK family antitoxin [Syntrophomonadaceae bacterium]
MIFLSVGKRIKDFSKVRIYSFMHRLKDAEGNMCSGDGRVEIKRLYYPNGNMKLETNNRNGKLDGIANYYYESGKLKAREFYKDNNIHGLSIWYYESGEIKSERYYKEGTLTQKKDYDKSGKILQI